MKTGLILLLYVKEEHKPQRDWKKIREEVRKGNSAAMKLVYLIKYEPNGERTSWENSEGKAALTPSMGCNWITMAGKSIVMTILD